MCKFTSVVYRYILVKLEAMTSCPVIIVTIRPGQVGGERGEEVPERPGQNNVVIAVEEEHDDQGRQPNPCNRNMSRDM